jgi:hypothetical protein
VEKQNSSFLQHNNLYTWWWLIRPKYIVIIREPLLFSHLLFFQLQYFFTVGTEFCFLKTSSIILFLTVPRSIQVWSNLFPHPWDVVLLFSTEYLHVHLDCSMNSHFHISNTYITSWTCTAARPCITSKIFFLLSWNYLTHTKTCNLFPYLLDHSVHVRNIYWPLPWGSEVTFYC